MMHWSGCSQLACLALVSLGSFHLGTASQFTGSSIALGRRDALGGNGLDMKDAATATSMGLQRRAFQFGAIGKRRQRALQTARDEAMNSVNEAANHYSNLQHTIEKCDAKKIECSTDKRDAIIAQLPQARQKHLDAIAAHKAIGQRKSLSLSKYFEPLWTSEPGLTGHAGRPSSPAFHMPVHTQ